MPGFQVGSGSGPTAGGGHPMGPAQGAKPGGDLPEGVLNADELRRRPARAPDFEAECRALTALAEGLTEAPRTVFQALVDAAVELCRAGSAGISVLEPGGEAGVLRWHAIAGRLAPRVG